MALYLYGLMRVDDGAAAVREAPADGPALQSIVHRGLCALVSDVPEGNLALRRESVLAHSRTLQAAFAHGPVLPMRFGTVLADAEVLERELMATQAESLEARLDALAGLAEMQVKATYLEEPLLRSILAQSPRLASKAARVRQVSAAASHFDRIALGEAIGTAVQARRELDAQRLLEPLHPLAVAVSVSHPSHERMVLNAAFLVERDRIEEFDGQVEALSQERAEEMQFKLLGPMPAHSFADRTWEGAPVPVQRERLRGDPLPAGGA